MPVSFGAKLITDENYGKKLPSYVDEENIKTIRDQYEKFIKTSKSSQLLIPDDEIVISTKKHPSSFSIDLDIYDKDSKETSKEPFQTTLCASKACKPKFRAYDLILLTYQYIAYKYNVKPKFGEVSFEYFTRAVDELLDEKEKNN